MIDLIYTLAFYGAALSGLVAVSFAMCWVFSKQFREGVKNEYH